jgi:hypothetical protein
MTYYSIARDVRNNKIIIKHKGARPPKSPPKARHDASFPNIVEPAPCNYNMRTAVPSNTEYTASVYRKKPSKSAEETEPGYFSDAPESWHVEPALGFKLQTREPKPNLYNRTENHIPSSASGYSPIGYRRVIYGPVEQTSEGWSMTSRDSTCSSRSCCDSGFGDQSSILDYYHRPRSIVSIYFPVSIIRR